MYCNFYAYQKTTETSLHNKISKKKSFYGDLYTMNDVGKAIYVPAAAGWLTVALVG